MYTSDDEILMENFLKNKNISIHSEKRYTFSINSFRNFLPNELHEFIKETKMKQLSYLKKTEIINQNGEKEIVQAYIEPDIENGDLAQTFRDYYDYGIEKGLSEVSIDTYINDIRTFLNKQGVKLPKKIDIDITKAPEKILKWEKIKRAIEKTPHIKNKAIFAFIASTGLRSKDVRSLKIKDFLKAVEIDTIEELFLNQENLIGYWELTPSKTKKRKFSNKKKKLKGYFCKTGNSPYSSNLIIEYLKKRALKENLTEDSYLFVTSDNNEKIKRGSFIAIFRRLNEKLEIDDLKWFKEQLDIWQYDEENRVPHKRGLSPEKYKEEISDICKFHAHGLRAYFINTVSSYCSNLKVGAAMEGHKSPVDTDSSYTNFDRGVILNYYYPLIPYISFEKTKINLVDSDSTKELKNKVQNLEEKLVETESENKNFINELEKIKKSNQKEMDSIKKSQKKILEQINH